MSSEISLNESFLWVSNQRLRTLLSFALRLGAEMARSDEERHYVERLQLFDDQAWPGIDLDLQERFPELAEKKFWACVFGEVAQRIFLRQIGNHAVLLWQSSAIGDAYIIERLLTRAVQQVELGWHPTVDDSREAQSDNGDGISVRL